MTSLSSNTRKWNFSNLLLCIHFMAIFPLVKSYSFLLIGFVHFTLFFFSVVFPVFYSLHDHKWFLFLLFSVLINACSGLGIPLIFLLLVIFYCTTFLTLVLVLIICHEYF